MTVDLSPGERYRLGLEAGELLYQRCTGCENAVFYPRVVCPSCGLTSLEWVRSEGAGTVYSTTFVRKREGGYDVSLINMDEGYRMMGTVSGSHPTAIGDRVLASVPVGTTLQTLCFRQVGIR